MVKVLDELMESVGGETGGSTTPNRPSPEP